MILFIVSGYAWWNRIVILLQLARYMHTQLDTYLIFIFLMHTLISTKFTLARWLGGTGWVVNGLLIIIGVASFLVILEIRIFGFQPIEKVSG